MPQRRPVHRTSRTLLAGLLIAMLFGCVMQERRDLAEAREAYDRCVREYSASQPTCIELDEKRRALQKEYEERAQRAWGCSPNVDECPPNR